MQINYLLIFCKEEANYRVISLVPISNENSVITSGIWEGDRNPWPAKDPDSPKTTGSLVEFKRREVVKAPNLILHLENVCEVLPWGYWAFCSIHPILKRVPPILNPVPIFSTNKNRNKFTIITNKTIISFANHQLLFLQ
jgi:hypothetical protein